jgi:hypothetical protein
VNDTGDSVAQQTVRTAGTFHIWKDGDETVATGHEGEFARDANPKVVIEACDQDGATLRFAGGSTYEYTDPPITLESNGLHLEGPHSARLKQADEQLLDDDRTRRSIDILGHRGTIRGLTLDFNQQNQPATDKYGIWFSEETEPRQWSIVNNRNIDACGDAYGNVTGGTRIIGCYAEGFSEDGIDFKNDGGPDDTQWVVVANSTFRGSLPVKINARGADTGWRNGLFSNCAFYDDGEGIKETIGRAINFAIDEGMTFENFLFSNCSMHTDYEDGDSAISFGGGGGTYRNIHFVNCRLRCGGRGINMLSGARKENITFWGGSIEAGTHPLPIKNAGENVRVVWPTVRPPREDWGGVTVKPDCNDVELRVRLPDSVSLDDEGTRTIVNGVGNNGSADPREGGDWNGHGHEGIVVHWDDDGTKTAAQFVGGDWLQIGRRE